MSKYLILLALILSACSQEGGPTEESISGSYVVRSEIFSSGTQIHESKKRPIINENWLTYLDDIDKFVIAYPADYPSEHPIFMSEMSIKRIETPSYCDHYSLGISPDQAIKLPEAKWGKVDYWDRGPHGIPGNELLPQPECRPGGGQKDAAYALCSEKDGKTVLICISQVTDNPDLAKQIFETFRWLD